MPYNLQPITTDCFKTRQTIKLGILKSQDYKLWLQTKFDWVDDYIKVIKRLLFQYILGELGIEVLAYAQNSLFVRVTTATGKTVIIIIIIIWSYDPRRYTNSYIIIIIRILLIRIRTVMIVITVEVWYWFEEDEF